MDDPASTITQDLDLDVPRSIEVPLEINLAAAEERARLALRDWQHPGKLGGVTGYFHAAPAAAGAGLDQHRISDRSGCALGGREIADGTRSARHRRNAELACGFFCRDF